MKKQVKYLLLVALFASTTLPLWSQATPSTEGKDFWVTFLRADEPSGGPTKLTLTISARKPCTVTIENTNANINRRININPGNTTIPMINDKNACYSYQSEQAGYTALHISSTEEISLFAGNYRDKSFDAANIYPTTALQDDYLIQTYPPSAHADNPQGSHFAIVATEDNTIVDYTLTAKTNGGRTGAQTTPTLNKGQVWYVWTGQKEGNEADLSGTTVKARNGKKIAVFQGCPHTNLPHGMRDRDHLFSQAMPLAYWGSEFGITLSRNHRRDIVAVMAINDGTQVYINDADGEKQLVHTFNFNSSDPQERKRYWTFEIGDLEAYSTHNESPYKGKLPEPLVADSSCFLTTSCPVGVHLFMVSNTYDEPTATHSSGSIGDPAMLWISPIEQVIKEISFSTYADGTDVHFMNILTTTADVPNMVWTDNTGAEHSIADHFHPLTGNSEYSYARIEINNGSHNLKGNVGFLAYVYGFGERCSYAYSCGSSTIQKSVTFNGTPLMIDSVYHGLFCVDEPIEMKLNIGNNDYQSIEWNFGDGITYEADPGASNNEKKQASHTYTSPGWYDLTVSAVYINQCTNQRFDEDLHFSFRVVRPDTIVGTVKPTECISLDDYKRDPAGWDEKILYGEIDTVQNHCYDDVVLDFVTYAAEKEEFLPDRTGQDLVYGYNGKPYTASTDVVDTIFAKDSPTGCNIYRYYHVEVITCLDLEIPNDAAEQHVCPGQTLTINYKKIKGNIDGDAIFRVPGYPDQTIVLDDHVPEGSFELPISDITKPGYYSGTLIVNDLYCPDRNPKEYPIDFTVYYPEDIFKYKFNNVLAVYKPGHGGNAGYEFTGYQWFRNGVPIEGATSSILYLGQGVMFESGDVVYVLLTDKDGMVLPSCQQVITDVKDYNPQPQNAPAYKQLIDHRIVIKKGEQSYNIYGQRIQ